MILLVDGNEDRLGRRRFLLETRGYRVVGASSSYHALELLETPMAAYDLLLADLLPPGMDGNELVRRAKALHPLLPALIVSDTVGSYERALAADAFLPKGAGTSAELLERVKILVARKRGPKRAPLPLDWKPGDNNRGCRMITEKWLFDMDAIGDYCRADVVAGLRSIADSIEAGYCDGRLYAAQASGLHGLRDTRHHMLLTFDIAAEPVRTFVALQGGLHE